MHRHYFPVPIPLIVPEVTALGTAAARDGANRLLVLLGLLMEPASPSAVVCGLSVEDATELRDCLTEALDFIRSRQTNSN